MNIPVRFPNPFADLADDDLGCDACGQYPVVSDESGDRLCQSCEDKALKAWMAEDHNLVPMSHPIMREASLKFEEARRRDDERLLAALRMPEDEFLGLVKDHRRFVRRNG